MITFTHIKKIYDNKIVLSIDNLRISENEFIGLVGNNGAGKTTMLSLILNLIKPTKGLIKSKLDDVSKSDNWKKYTGAFLNENSIIPFLTPLEFFEFIASLHDLNLSYVNSFLKENAGFYEQNVLSGKLIRELSKGNKNKVGILASFLSKPELLILDEPFSNLDPSSQSWLKIKLKKLSDEGVTIIISSHDLKHVSEICNRILVLEDGLIVKDKCTDRDTLTELEKYFNLKNQGS